MFLLLMAILVERESHNVFIFGVSFFRGDNDIFTTISKGLTILMVFIVLNFRKISSTNVCNVLQLVPLIKLPFLLFPKY